MRICLARVRVVNLFLVEGRGRSEWIGIGRFRTGELRRRVLIVHGDG